MAETVSGQSDTWKRLGKAERRAQLLEIAVDLFRTQDYEEISVKDVAQRAGISHGLIYHYFPSKQALFLAAVQQSVDELIERIGELDPGVPPAEAALSGIAGYLDFVLENSQVYANLFVGPISSMPELMVLVDGCRARIANLVLAPYAEGAGIELPATRLFLSGAQAFIEVAVLHWLKDQRPERAELEVVLALQLGYSLKQGLMLDLPPDHPLRVEIGPISEDFEAQLNALACQPR